MIWGRPFGHWSFDPNLLFFQFWASSRICFFVFGGFWVQLSTWSTVGPEPLEPKPQLARDLRDAFEASRRCTRDAPKASRRCTRIAIYPPPPSRVTRLPHSPANGAPIVHPLRTNCAQLVHSCVSNRAQVCTNCARLVKILHNWCTVGAQLCTNCARLCTVGAQLGTNCHNRVQLVHNCAPIVHDYCAQVCTNCHDCEQLVHQSPMASRNRPINMGRPGRGGRATETRVQNPMRSGGR